MGHHRPASETQFGCRFAGGPRWPNIECWLGSFVVLQGNRTSIAKKPYSFAIFEGGGGGRDSLFPLWIREGNQCRRTSDCPCISTFNDIPILKVNYLTMYKLVHQASFFVWFCVCKGDNLLAKARYRGYPERTHNHTYVNSKSMGW